MKKAVLVTGSSKGLGASIIRLFSQNNYNVIINYNNSEKQANDLSEYIKSEYNVETLVVKCDVSNEDEVIKMVDISVDKFEKIDVSIPHHVFDFSFLIISSLNSFIISWFESIPIKSHFFSRIFNIFI